MHTRKEQMEAFGRFLDILDEIEFIQPQAHILLSRVNSDEFLKYACRVIRKGRGWNIRLRALFSETKS